MGWAKYYEDNLELVLSREPLIFEQNTERSVAKAKTVCKELADAVQNNNDVSKTTIAISTKANAKTDHSATKMQYKPKELYCQECGRLFLFSSKAQEIFAGNGWNPPKRCKACRDNRTIRYLMRAS